MTETELDGVDKVFHIGPNFTAEEMKIAQDVLDAEGILQNPSGIQPLEHKVLLQPQASVKVTSGGVHLPDEVIDSEKFKTVRGTIIALSPFAFSYVSDAEWAMSSTPKPKPGDTVLYAKFAGMWIKGSDGEEYLLANDEDLIAVVRT